MDWFRNTLYGLLIMVTAVTSSLVVSACEHDFCKAGNSELPYPHTDFIEAGTNELSAFVSTTTDSGTQLALKLAIEEQWAKGPDTTYRALLYYNKVENGITSSFAVGPVAILCPCLALDLSTVHIDPIGSRSVRISKNRRYLNPTLSLKTGETEGERVVQTLTIIYDSAENLLNGGRVFHLRLHHHQNGVPEHYSGRVLTNIPLNDSRQQDSIYLSINTYKGEISKQATF